MGRLILVMGDQLSWQAPHLKDAVPGQDVIVMGEIAGEATRPRHHKQKIALIFSAMRHFREALSAHGFTVLYHFYDAQSAIRNFEDLLQDAHDQTGLTDIVMTQASEYRVAQWQSDLRESWTGDITIHQDSRFLASHDEFALWAKGKKQLRMEFFYRNAS